MKRLLFMVGLIVALVACQSEESDTYSPKERKDIVLSRAEEQMTEESTEFAFRFFKQINQSEVQEPNWMVSPLSASYALGMMTNGAAGNTLDEMKNTLGFSNSSLDEMNAYYKRLTHELLGLDNTTTMGIANSVWVKEGFMVYDSFIDVNKKMYQAKISNLDFTSSNAPTVINDWCADQTNGCIKEVVKTIPEEARMYLLNALYFKGIWKNQFKKTSTKIEDFCGVDGIKSKVHMMNQTGNFKYTYGGKFCMAEFPYGNEAFSLVVVLPDEEQKLDEVLDRLTFDYWKELNDKLVPANLNVKFPCFELKYKKDLVEDMIAMGLKDAFDEERANFSNISTSPLFLGLLDQHTYIKVDEEGTEAAVVTVGGYLDNSVGPSNPFTFHMNRPFAFFIKEKSTGTILFMGKVTKL